ncbi:MAG: hypothetical protein JWQ01_4831 [Massilia sp.]|nr:hypothetical protein [Massilia sp.]
MELFHELEASYAVMSPWARRQIREIAREYALNWPAMKNVPLLTLVVSQPAENEISARLLNRDINLLPAILVREAVDQ